MNDLLRKLTTRKSDTLNQKDKKETIVNESTFLRHSNHDDSVLDQIGAEDVAPTVSEGSVEEFKLNIININKKFFNPNLDFNSKLKAIMELAKKSNSIDE
jgi:hypothetical protein